MTFQEALVRLQALGNSQDAQGSVAAFSSNRRRKPTGGVPDLFLGVKAAPLRKLARELQDLPISETLQLLQSGYHEARSLALLIFVRAFSRGNSDLKTQIYNHYLQNTLYVNNWDLVDVSAPFLVGPYLQDRGREPLYELARSLVLWERRIAIVATQHFITPR